MAGIPAGGENVNGPVWNCLTVRDSIGPVLVLAWARNTPTNKIER